MTYTVKQLAKLSNVSVRTLHWYDRKDLLKPAFYGENGYRYYEEEQLLILQQILFFKEMGMRLDVIQKILSANDFDKIKSLETHARILKKDLKRKENLLTTVEKTLNHLKGKQKMDNKDLYYGFDSNRQKEYEQYLVHYHGKPAEKLLKESHRKTAKWDKHQWDEVKTHGDQIHKDLSRAIDDGLAPESDTVQTIINRHYHLQNRFFDVSKEVYIGLSSLYKEHPDFKKFFDHYHPDIIDYLGKAMRFYAQKNL